MEQLADLGPRVAGRPRLFNQSVQRVLDDHVETPGRGNRAHDLAGRVALDAGLR